MTRKKDTIRASHRRKHLCLNCFQNLPKFPVGLSDCLGLLIWCHKQPQFHGILCLLSLKNFAFLSLCRVGLAGFDSVPSIFFGMNKRNPVLVGSSAPPTIRISNISSQSLLLFSRNSTTKGNYTAKALEAAVSLPGTPCQICSFKSAILLWLSNWHCYQRT